MERALLLEAWIDEAHERKLIMRATISDPDRNVCVHAKGVFVKVKPGSGFK